MKQWIHDIRQFAIRYPSFLWCCFASITFLLYHGTQDIVLNDDAFQFFAEFRKEGWGGFYQNYGFSSLYYVTHAVNIFFYGLFGTHTYYWSILLILLHSTNAFLGFRVFYLFYQKNNIPHAYAIAICGALIFLISPSQSENITWVATMHYGLSMLLFLSISLVLLNSKKELSHTYIILILLVYVMALLSMEFALVFPFAWFVLHNDSWKNLPSVKNKKLWMGLCLLIPIYFISTKIIKGHFIPHYSTEHLENHHPLQYITSYTNYASKHLLLSHFYPFAVKYYAFLDRFPILLILWIFLGVLFFRFLSSKKNHALVLLKLLTLSFFLLMPVINMYFNIIHQYENNRLGYYFSLVMFQIFVFILFEFRSTVRIVILAIYIPLNLYGTLFVVEDAKIAGRIYQNTIATFPAISADSVYLMNMPNNYKGFYLFRDTWRLESALHFFQNKKYHFIQLASTNLLHASDSFHYSFSGDTLLKVGHQNPGDYFMKGPYGAFDREDADYTFDVDEWLMNYEVRFKKPISDKSQFVLFQKDSFRIVR